MSLFKYVYYGSACHYQLPIFLKYCNMHDPFPMQIKLNPLVGKNNNLIHSIFTLD